MWTRLWKRKRRCDAPRCAALCRAVLCCAVPCLDVLCLDVCPAGAAWLDAGARSAAAVLKWTGNVVRRMACAWHTHKLLRSADGWLVLCSADACLPSLLQASYNQGVALFEQGLITAALPK